MKRIIIFNFLILSLSLSSQELEREVFGIDGGIFQNEEIHLSYTLGESFINYQQSSEYLIHEGFQQGNILNILSHEDFSIELSEDIIIFPNPINEELNLMLSSNFKGKGTIEVRNSLGSLIWFEEQYFSTGTLSKKILLGEIAPGMYHLIITQNDKRYSLKFMK